MDRAGNRCLGRQFRTSLRPQSEARVTNERLGTRLGASAIVAVIAFGLEWIGGIAGRLAFQFSNDALVNATTAISLALPSDSYWRAAQWAVQPAVFTAALNTREGIARAGPFAGAVPPTTAMLVWTALWIVAVLGVAMRAFARRDL